MLTPTLGSFMKDFTLLMGKGLAKRDTPYNLNKNYGNKHRFKKGHFCVTLFMDDPVCRGLDLLKHIWYIILVFAGRKQCTMSKKISKMNAICIW